MKTSKIIEMLTSEYPYGIDLVYIDYDDELSSEQLEEIVQTGYIENGLDWLSDATFQAVDAVIDELFDNKLTDNQLEIVQEWLYDHDTSNPTHDLLKNSSDLLYYNTPIEIDGLDYSTIEDNRKIIYKELNLKRLSKDNRSTLEKMIANSYDGGTLCLLLNTDDFTVFEGKEITNCNTITIKNPVIGIINRNNGSGAFETLEGIEIEIPFTRENLHTDTGSSGYSILETFGTYSNIGSTMWNIINKTKQTPAKINAQELERDKKEKEYIQNYKNGKCTHSDMNLKRHRNVEYINNYPCGIRCKDCGTFWID